MNDLFTDYLPPTILNDAFGLLCGAKIGRGTYRDVFEFSIDPALVVKLETRNSADDGPGFCNVHEHTIWVESKKSPWRRWLAPVIYISAYGTAMLMKRTTPLREDQRPSVVPNFLADLKLENWGMLDGQPVVHDYGNHAIYALARDAFDMVPGRWHDGKGKTLPPAT